MSRYTIIKALALAVLGGLVGADYSPGKHRASQHARTPRFKWNYSKFHKDRSPDESVRRLAAAHTKRNAKAAARLRWRAAGGASTLAERTAAGVPGV